jgi:hypothetical protein
MTLSDRPSPYSTRATRSEPEIDFGFEGNVLRMTGECYMIDTHGFFTPHEEWLKAFLNGLNEPVTFVFQLTRANSSSKQHIVDIVELLEKNSSATQPTVVEWHTNPVDEGIVHLGKELQSRMKSLKATRDPQAEKNASHFEFRIIPPG